MFWYSQVPSTWSSFASRRLFSAIRAPLKDSLGTSSPLSSQLSTEGAKKSMNELAPGSGQRKWIVASQVNVSLSRLMSSEMSYSGVWIS